MSSDQQRKHLATPTRPDPGEYIHVQGPQTWARLFDEVLVPQAHEEYGFLPDHWKEARRELVDVDGGRARLVLHHDQTYLLRGTTLQQASVVLLLLKRLVDAGIPVRFDPEAEA